MRKTILIALAICLSLFAFSIFAANSPPVTVQQQTVAEHQTGAAVGFQTETSVRKIEQSADFRAVNLHEKINRREYGELPFATQLEQHKTFVETEKEISRNEYTREIYELPQKTNFNGFGTDTKARAKI